MRIGEVAERVGVTTSAIRYYERIGILPEPDRTASGYRDYGEEGLERLRFVKAAQSLGLTLDDIREILGFRDRGEPPCPYVREAISRQAEEVDRRIAELRRLRGQLAEMADRAARMPDGAGTYCGIIEHATGDGDDLA